MTDHIKLFLSYYRTRINCEPSVPNLSQKQSDLAHWKDIVFMAFLEYCLPVSLIAIIPGVYMSLRENLFSIAWVDVSCVIGLMFATFGRQLKLISRKFIVVSLFYFLGIFLIVTFGHIGPGAFYLLAMTVLIALILPMKYAYWSVLLNIVTIAVFAILISLNQPSFALGERYNPGEWIAFSSNLVFLALVLVLVIHKIFDGLQVTIHKKDHMRENYTRIFNNSPIPMWLFDTDSLQFLTVNHAAIQQYGYTREEFMAMTIQGIRSKKFHQEIEEIVFLNRAENKFRKQNVQHIKKNGEIIHVTIESSLLNYKGKNAKLVLATDVTAQVKAEFESYKANLKTKESEANLHAIFNSAADGFLLLDKHNHIVAFNDKAKNSIRFNKNRLPFSVGANIFEYVPELQLSYFKNVLNEVRGGKVLEYDRMFRVDGAKLWVHYTVTPVVQDGLREGICINGRDITAYHNHISTIESQNKVLKDISWAQSHLVRAPLARIMGLKNLLLEEMDHKDRAAMLTYLGSSVSELDTIIKQIVVNATAIDKKDN